MRAGALGFVAGLAALLAAPATAQLSDAEEVMVEPSRAGSSATLRCSSRSR